MLPGPAFRKRRRVSQAQTKERSKSRDGRKSCGKKEAKADANKIKEIGKKKVKIMRKKQKGKPAGILPAEKGSTKRQQETRDAGTKKRTWSVADGEQSEKGERNRYVVVCIVVDGQRGSAGQEERKKCLVEAWDYWTTGCS